MPRVINKPYRRALVPPTTSQKISDHYFTDTELLPPSQVMGIFGDKGSGKSLLAAWMAERRHRATGKKILHFPDSFNHIHGEPISITEMANGSDRMNGAILIWDEAQVILNKYRSSSTANRALVAFLTQVRKRGAFLYYTSNAPKQLDKALGEQTDVHGYCVKKTDPRCEWFMPKTGPRRHLKDCLDHIRITWVDTQGVHGVNPAARDRRWRRPQNLRRIVNYYGLYNTLAQVEQAEIDNVSKDVLAEAREDVKSGVEFAEFVEMMRGWIIELLSAEGPKPSRIIPATFANTIKTDTGLDVSATRVGMACKALGLQSKRSERGVSYNLPDADTLHLWARGLA